MTLIWGRPSSLGWCGTWVWDHTCPKARRVKIGIIYQKTKSVKKIKDIKDGDWISLDSANPKENILEDSMIMNQLKTNGTDISFLFACLISIKLEVISEMNTRLRDRESLLNAMMNEDEEFMNEMKKKYPEMNGTSIYDFNKIILEGMDKKSFEAELAKQIDHLQCYIFKCYANAQLSERRKNLTQKNLF